MGLDKNVSRLSSGFQNGATNKGDGQVDRGSVTGGGGGSFKRGTVSRLKGFGAEFTRGKNRTLSEGHDGQISSCREWGDAGHHEGFE